MVCRLIGKANDTDFNLSFSGMNLRTRLSNGLYQKAAVENSDIFVTVLISETTEAGGNSLHIISTLQLLFTCMKLVTLKLLLEP